MEQIQEMIGLEIWSIHILLFVYWLYKMQFFFLVDFTTLMLSLDLHCYCIEDAVSPLVHPKDNIET